MPDLRQMHPNLVRAPGRKPAFKKTRNGLSFGTVINRARPVAGDRAPPARAHGHLHARARIAADRLIDLGIARMRNAPDEGEIAAFEPALRVVVGELRR